MFDPTADIVFADGPAGSPNNPLKSEIRKLLRQYEMIMNAFTTGGTGVLSQSKALLDANLNYPALTMIWVMNDPVSPSNNGIYQKQGATGSGSWVRVGDLPYSFIQASNAGAGTVNAIVATSSIPIPAADGGALIMVNVTAANTGPATISFNGASALNIISSSGNAMQDGYLTAGMVIAGVKVGSDFHLLSDAATAAMVTLAEQAVLDAKAEANRAEAAAAAIATAPQWAFPTRNDMLTLFDPVSPPAYVTIAGNLYNYSAVEPTHSGKAQDKAGNWYVVAPNPDGKYSAAALGLCDSADAADRLVGFAAAGITHINVPRGQTMVLTTPAILNTDADVSIGGEGTIDCSTSEARIEINGSYVVLPALASDIPAGSTTITFAAAHGLAYNDRIVLADTRPYSAGLARHYYHQGFNAIVASAPDSTSITIFEATPCDIEAAYVDVGKLPGGKATLGDELTIVPNTSSDAPILFRRRRIVRLDASNVPVGSGYTNMTVSQCYDVHATDVRGNVEDGDAYPLTVNSCQKVLLDSITATFSPRHAVAVGGGGLLSDGYGNVPTRDLKAFNCIFSSSGGVGAADFHGGVFDSEFTNCTMKPNCDIGGGDNKLVNCTIYGADGKCIRLTEFFGGLLEINNCTLVVYEVDDVEGVIFLLTNMLSKDTTIKIHNLTIENRASTPSAYLRPMIVSAGAIAWDASTGAYPTGLAEKNMYVVTVAGTVDGILREVGDLWVYPGASYMVPGTEGGLLKSPAPKVNVIFSGETRLVNVATSYAVVLAGLVDMTTRFTLKIDDIRGVTSGGNRYFVCSSTDNAAGCKVTLPRQTLKFSGTTPTDSQDLIPAAQSFPWQYPKKPFARASWWAGIDTLIAGSLADVFCNVGQLSATAAQPYLRKSAAAWAGANPVGMAVEAWIDELS